MADHSTRREAYASWARRERELGGMIRALGLEAYAEAGKAMLQQADRIERALMRDPEGPTRADLAVIGRLIEVDTLEARVLEDKDARAALEASGMSFGATPENPPASARPSGTSEMQRRLSALLREALASLERYAESANPEDLAHASELNRMAQSLFGALRTE